MTNWKARLEALGRVGVVVHLVGFVVCMVAMSASIRFGFLAQVPWLAERLPADATMLVGAYALTKVLSVPRIALTLSVTPLLVRALGRVPGAA